MGSEKKKRRSWNREKRPNIRNETRQNLKESPQSFKEFVREGGASSLGEEASGPT